jgi:hypothetical protein
MASLTISIDPELLEPAKLEAERRHITLDELVADKLAAIANIPSQRKRDNSALVRLMEEESGQTSHARRDL